MKVTQVILVFSLSLILFSCHDDDNNKLDFSALELKQTQWKGTFLRELNGRKSTESAGIIFYSDNKGLYSVQGAEYSPYGGGHICFCDGYYEQGYTVTKKNLGIKVKLWKEYDDRLYMNWGWGINQGNGWYCATDDVWTSLESNPDVNFKTDTQI